MHHKCSYHSPSTCDNTIQSRSHPVPTTRMVYHTITDRQLLPVTEWSPGPHDVMFHRDPIPTMYASYTMVPVAIVNPSFFHPRTTSAIYP